MFLLSEITSLFDLSRYLDRSESLSESLSRPLSSTALASLVQYNDQVNQSLI